MFKLIFIFFAIYVGFYLYQNKILVRLDTLFRKGFHHTNDKFGVYCFVGKQGAGKTMSCIDFIYDVLGDKRVITNVKSFADKNKDLCIYEPNFYVIIEKFNNGTYDNNYVIFYDELFTLLEKGKLNSSILSFISQLRKRGIYFVTTVQEWLDINVTFRRYVRYQVDCSMINFLNVAFSINQIHDGYSMKWDKDLNEYSAPILLTTIKKCSLDVVNSYDTYEVIKVC